MEFGGADFFQRHQRRIVSAAGEIFFASCCLFFFLNLLNLTARAIENSDFKAEYWAQISRFADGYFPQCNLWCAFFDCKRDRR